MIVYTIIYKYTPPFTIKIDTVPSNVNLLIFSFSKNVKRTRGRAESVHPLKSQHLLLSLSMSPLSRLIGVGAAGSIAAACVLLLIAMGRDAPQLSPSYDSPFKWTTFLMSFGMIFFAFGSHPSLPTFQADMKQPNKFNLVCLISYSSK